jgi:hypothetical protein
MPALCTSATVSRPRRTVRCSRTPSSGLDLGATGPGHTGPDLRVHAVARPRSRLSSFQSLVNRASRSRIPSRASPACASRGYGAPLPPASSASSPRGRFLLVAHNARSTSAPERQLLLLHGRRLSGRRLRPRSPVVCSRAGDAASVSPRSPTLRRGDQALPPRPARCGGDCRGAGSPDHLRRS